MSDQGLSEKERALLAAARREVAAKKAAAPARPAPAGTAPAGAAPAGTAPAKPAAPRPAVKPAAAPPRARSAGTPAAASTPLNGRTVTGWDHPAAQPRRAPSTPMDAPTVAGWDHPAAQGAGATDTAKWERIAALMEAEREETRERHRRAQRGAVIFLGVLFLLVVFAGLKILAR